MKLYTAKDMSVVWGISGQMVRRYCIDGKVPGAVLTDKGWMIPEGTPKPGAISTKEEKLTPLMKRIRYERQRNNHYGIYEYIQVNLAYSSCRMASNRLTLMQVENVYRTNKIATAFEPTKVDDIIEVVNHFICMCYVVDNVNMPLSVSFVKHLHHLLSYGTYADRSHKTGVGEFRTQTVRINQTPTTPPKQIDSALSELIKAYEKKTAKLEQILDFHVRFERIRPFDDYNGRVGRAIMMKECLRHGIDPFIVDDKRRSSYTRGIACWDDDPNVLKTAVLEAQERFQNKMDVCRLMNYHRQPNN